MPRRLHRSLSRHSLHFTPQSPEILPPPTLRTAPPAAPIAPPAAVQIPLTTVSEAGNFDAYMNIGLTGSTATPSVLIDSGNSMLVVPDYSDISGNPNYTVLLGGVQEPWECPANVVQGPITLFGTLGPVVIPQCVFYACTAANSRGERTANFGLGCIKPWSSCGWNTPAGLASPMQAPLSYLNDYPYCVVEMAPTSSLFANDGGRKVNSESILTLYANLPAGYTMFNVVQNFQWMAVPVSGLSIAGTPTGWPGGTANAFVDTGGGPVFLSDPNGYVYNRPWPDAVTCPAWSSGSTNCECVDSDIGVTLGDNQPQFAYAIVESDLPASAQGLTAVLCQKNEYMMGQYGMNIGGISMLFITILIDYAQSRVGFSSND